jgi:hypothetical protein
MLPTAAPMAGHLYEVEPGRYLMLCAHCQTPARSPHAWLLEFWLKVHQNKCGGEKHWTVY